MDRLKTIGTFVQIAQSLSLSKAADELGISRALASNHLKQLEGHLGVRLVNRTTRKLALTEAGSEYLTFCLDALNSFEEEEARISRLQNEPQGHLKIMASMSFGNLHLAPAITEFTAEYGQVKVSLILSDRSFSPSDFVEGGYDLGISMQSVRDASIVSTKVGEVSWLPCVTPRYRETQAALDSPYDLARHNCLVHRSYAPQSIWRFSGPKGRCEIAVKGSLFTNSVIVLRAAVLADSGVAMLPLYCIDGDLESGALVRVLPDYASPKRPVYLVYPQMRYLPKRVRLFLDFLKDRLKRQRL